MAHKHTEFMLIQIFLSLFVGDGCRRSDFYYIALLR